MKGKNNANYVKYIGMGLTLALIVNYGCYLLFNPSFAPKWYIALPVLLITGAMWAIGAHPKWAVKFVTGQFRSNKRHRRR